jgi:hypothetical protein
MDWDAFFIRVGDAHGPRAIADALPSALAKWPGEAFFIMAGARVAAVVAAFSTIKEPQE